MCFIYFGLRINFCASKICCLISKNVYIEIHFQKMLLSKAQKHEYLEYEYAFTHANINDETLRR